MPSGYRGQKWNYQRNSCNNLVAKNRPIQNLARAVCNLCIVNVFAEPKKCTLGSFIKKQFHRTEWLSWAPVVAKQLCPGVHEIQNSSTLFMEENQVAKCLHWSGSMQCECLQIRSDTKPRRFLTALLLHIFPSKLTSASAWNQAYTSLTLYLSTKSNERRWC